MWDRFSYDRIYHEPTMLKRRALDALTSMWRPESPGRENQNVLDILQRFLQGSGEPDLRLHVLNRMAARTGATNRNSLPRLSDWEISVGICPPDTRADVQEFFFGDEDFEWFHDQGLLAVSLHLDHPRVFRVVTKLKQPSGTRARLCEALFVETHREKLTWDGPRRSLLVGPWLWSKPFTGIGRATDVCQRFLIGRVDPPRGEVSRIDHLWHGRTDQERILRPGGQNKDS